jgi:hypothetical protein
MSRDAEESNLEQASEDVARAIWQVVLVAGDKHKARKKLVDRILELMRVVRRSR